MIGGVSIPTSARLMNAAEWAIVDRVFKAANLPYKIRIWITNGSGLGGAPFTIPTSLVTTVFGAVGTWFSPVAIGGNYLTSVVNLGYLMNVGTGAYPDMTVSPAYQSLLVHETTHVWQGRNSIFALTYVISSVVSQCAGIRGTSGLSGRSAAYAYAPGLAWGSYNAEQQACIVEDWFAAGEPTGGPLYSRYIVGHIRLGRT
ncbi:MAG TPA: hypothetical protein VMU82_09820 [Acetobacteraceae bacterium]|nr:hypothetical protein [Acetobacteraceae bacterium]